MNNLFSKHRQTACEKGGEEIAYCLRFTTARAGQHSRNTLLMANQFTEFYSVVLLVIVLESNNKSENDKKKSDQRVR